MSRPRSYFLHGAHNFICDICGQKRKSIDKRKNWKGLIVCPECWDPKPRQEYPIKHREEQRAVIDASPRETDIDGSPHADFTWDTHVIEWGNQFIDDNWEEA